MTAADFFERPDVRRATRFMLAIGGGAFLLWALAVRARGDASGGAGLDEVRLIAAAACVLAAIVAPRIASRVEAIGFLLAGAALAASVGGDHLTAWVSSRLGFLSDVTIEDRVLLLRASWAVLVLGLPVAIGTWVLRIPVPDLLRPPRPTLRPFFMAVVAGFALYPVLSLSTSAVNALVDGWVGMHAHPWPGWREALRAEIIEGVVKRPSRWVALALAVELPLLEIFLHGVLRQALSRWGVVGFVVGTAILGPLLMLSGQLSFFLFGGLLLTGLFAARTASIVPGFAFWASLISGWIAWGWILPAV